jgi:hypothetical protein
MKERSVGLPTYRAIKVNVGLGRPSQTKLQVQERNCHVEEGNIIAQMCKKKS